MLIKETEEGELRVVSAIEARFWRDFEQLASLHPRKDDIQSTQVQRQAIALAAALKKKYRTEPFVDAIPVFPGAFDVPTRDHFIMNSNPHEHVPLGGLYALINPKDGRELANVRPISRGLTRTRGPVYKTEFRIEDSADARIRESGRHPFNLDQCMCLAMCRPEVLDGDYRIDAVASRMIVDVEYITSVPFVQKLATISSGNNTRSAKAVAVLKGRPCAGYPNHGAPSYEKIVQVEHRKKFTRQKEVHSPK